LVKLWGSHQEIRPWRLPAPISSTPPFHAGITSSPATSAGRSCLGTNTRTAKPGSNAGSKLVDIFAICIGGFAVLDNHLHQLVRLDPALGEGWSDDEVSAAGAGSSRPATRPARPCRSPRTGCRLGSSGASQCMSLCCLPMLSYPVLALRPRSVLSSLLGDDSGNGASVQRTRRSSRGRG
jgi:hypothetical protein